MPFPRQQPTVSSLPFAGSRPIRWIGAAPSRTGPELTGEGSSGCRLTPVPDAGAAPHGPAADLTRDGAEIGLRADGCSADPAAFRQLRHQTKNALQRIIGEVGKVRNLQDSPRGRRLVQEVERRVLLASAVSDALFGLTRAPGPLPERLLLLGESVVELLGDPDQTIRVEVAAEGACPGPLHDAIVRVAHELIGNAVKHGMHARLLGRIRIGLVSAPTAGSGTARAGVGGWTRLTVADDGWGPGRSIVAGEGLQIAEEMARAGGGMLSLARHDDETVAELRLPHPAT